METKAHRRLKQLALAFLREHGCRCAATEVQCPFSRYRVDLAGYIDRAPEGGEQRAPRRCPPRTVLVECKQAWSDFLRDRRDLDRLLARRAGLERIRAALERRIMKSEPHLRRAGSSLFPEMEEWDFSASRLPAYRDLLRQLRRLDAMIHGETKFCLAARYALADRLYVAAPRGMLARRELPPGWGLLECAPRALAQGDPNADLFGDSVLRVTVPAPVLPARAEYRQRLLRNIAVAASRVVSRAMAVTF